MSTITRDDAYKNKQKTSGLTNNVLAREREKQNGVFFTSSRSHHLTLPPTHPLPVIIGSNRFEPQPIPHLILEMPTFSSVNHQILLNQIQPD